VALFQRLGGRDGVEALVEDLAVRVREDPEIGHYFDEVDEVELNRHRTMFFSALLGGTEEYGGRTIRAAHSPFRLTEGDFDAFIRLITLTLAGSSASPRDQRSILRALERLRSTVVHASAPEAISRRVV
jgi:hemoglobin